VTLGRAKHNTIPAVLHRAASRRSMPLSYEKMVCDLIPAVKKYVDSPDAETDPIREAVAPSISPYVPKGSKRQKTKAKGVVTRRIIKPEKPSKKAPAKAKEEKEKKNIVPVRPPKKKKEQHRPSFSPRVHDLYTFPLVSDGDKSSVPDVPDVPVTDNRTEEIVLHCNVMKEVTVEVCAPDALTVEVCAQDALTVEVCAQDAPNERELPPDQGNGTHENTEVERYVSFNDDDELLRYLWSHS